MRTLLTLLLLCWVSSTADGLKCYVCDPTMFNTICNINPITCQTPLDTCATGVITGGSSSFIFKQCTSQCNAFASSQLLGNINASLTCCKTDLCNASGATTSRLHTLLLALPLAAISALRYVTA